MPKDLFGSAALWEKLGRLGRLRFLDDEAHNRINRNGGQFVFTEVALERRQYQFEKILE